MNILYVNTYYNGGGAENVMRQLYLGLKDENIHTYCIVGRYQKNVPQDVQIAYKNFLGRVFTTIRGTILRNTLLNARQARKMIVRCIKQNNIDIVHFHNIHSNYLGLKDIKKIKKHCPNIVITLHDMWAITGGCAHAFDCDKWKTEFCSHCDGNDSMKKFPLSSFLFQEKVRALSNSAIKFVVPSFWLKECCDKSYLKNEDISVIYNGVSLDDYIVNEKESMRQKYEIPSNKHILLFAANGIDNVYKGFKYLIEALQLLGKKDEYALVIIGNKNNVKLELPFETCQFGYVNSRKMLNEIYSAADLFILPSVADTLPFTAMEAMASGTPVLAFETGGIPEIVSNDVGWIVETGNEKALAKQIENIFCKNNYEEYIIKQRKCHERIEKLFDEKIMLKQYCSLYEDLILE